MSAETPAPSDASGQRSRRAILALVLGAILFVASLVFVNSSIKGVQIDLTERDLYSLSDSTRRMLGGLDEPITITLYYSPTLAEASPRFALHIERVREMLQRYSDLSNGYLDFVEYEIEAFSESEDRAVAAGLRGVPINSAGDLGYFGLLATNTTDGREIVPFFNLQREGLLEYDLTRIIYSLSTPEKKKIGLISTLGLEGNPMIIPGQPGGEPWVIMEQIQQFFEVESLGRSPDRIPEGIQTLMVVRPEGLDEPTLYAIDQFVMRGGRLLLFVDPVAETGELNMPPGLGGIDLSEANVLLKSYGLEMPKDKVATDIKTANRVSARTDRGEVLASYVAWLALTEDYVSQEDPVTSDISRLIIAAPGALRATGKEGVTVTRLAHTSEQGALMEAEKFKGRTDIVALMREYRPGDQPLMLAARVTGQFESAFPEGAPKPREGEAEKKEPLPAHLAKAEAEGTVIVVSDADLLYDQFWVNMTDYFGQKVAVPTADNATFVINALENLSGINALGGLRGRSEVSRPFTMVDDLQRQAEQTFRAQEERLLARLKELEQELGALAKTGDGGGAILSEKDQAAIAQFRAEMITVRRELREVQRALRQDIEQLDRTIKAINIAALPALIIIIAIALAVRRQNRRGRMVETADLTSAKS